MGGFRVPGAGSRPRTVAVRGRHTVPPDVRAAAARVVETLESRLLLHAGHTDEPAVALRAAAAPVTVAQAVPGTPLSLTAVSPRNGAQNVAATAVVTATFAAALDPATVTAANVELRDAANAVVPAAVSYDAATKTVTLAPAGPLPASGYVYAKVRGGAAGVRDVDGNALAADYRWSFSTAAPTFTETVVFSNLDHATAVRFAPDGRVFVAQKGGVIKTYDSLADATPTTVADLRTQVHNFWDRGLLGMALDPNFAANGYLYVLYTYDAALGGTAPTWGVPGGTDDGGGPSPTVQGAIVSGRLSRLTLDASGVMVPGSEKVLVADWQQQFYTHSVGTVAFGPDGALYASAGEGASPEYADSGQAGNPFGDPVNEGGALRSQDLRTPNDSTTLDGTIIRIDPATGLALPSNPNYATGHDENARRIISYGYRNPYRFTFKPGTDEIWLGDVGWNTYEEINRLPTPSAGLTNYGWPAYEGPARQPGYDAANLPVLEALYAEGPTAVRFPHYSYNHAEQVVPGSGEPTGGSGISGVSFYDGGTYPAAYDGALFFTDYARQRIWVMYKGVDGLPDPATRQVFRTVSGPVDLQTGPNGDLFYVDYNMGTVRRFQFFSTNRPPTAAVSADKNNGAVPLAVNFTAAASTDPDAGDVLDYAWDLDGDGEFDDSALAEPSYAYATAGDRTVKVRVTDRAGLTDTATLVVHAGNTAPVPTITSPLSSIRWTVGETINFAGAALDAEDGALAASKLTWSLVIHHDNLIDPSNSHEHFIQSFEGVAGGSFVAPDHGYPSRLTLRLTATDAGGLSATTSVELIPKTVDLTLAAAPAGLKVAVNGESLTTPFTTTVIAGSTNSVSAPAAQVLGGRTYNFAGWSDGGAASHTYVAAVTSTLTADYVAAALPSLAVTATTPRNGSQNVAAASAVTVTFNAGLKASTLTAATFDLRNKAGTVIPSTLTYDAATRTATLTPTVALPASNDYLTARVRGGAAGVTDAAGNYLPADFEWSFTTGKPVFTQTTALSGLTQPMAVEFAPDGRVFVAEKSGIIRVFPNASTNTSTVVADLRTQVHNFWDRGLMSLTLHPDFANNPYVYVAYAYDADMGGTAPKYGTAGATSDPGPNATTTGALISGRVSRLTVSGNAMVPGSEVVLVNDWQQQFPTHSLGNVAFGPDGALYVSGGDGAGYTFADYGQVGNPFNEPVNEGGALKAQDILTPTDPTSLGGSIIRIDPMTGAALPSNPLYATGNDAKAKMIVAHGLRNPLRFTFRPGTNEIWVGDVGYDTWEEVNRVVSPTAGVTNLGWPAYEGDLVQPGYAALTGNSLLNSLYAAGPGAVTKPYFTYNHAAQVVAGSGEATGGSSVTGVAFYDGGTYPSAYNGALFFADYSRRNVYVMYRGPDGLPDPATRQVFSDDANAVMLKVGPGGDLFRVDYDHGEIRRYQFFSANHPPTAVATATPNSGTLPLTVSFSAAGSSDPDAGATLSYAWDLDADGDFDDASGVAATYTYATGGDRTVRVRVTDEAGASAVASVVVHAGNTAPVPQITAPLSTLRWSVGQTINFAGSALDAQDGALTGGSLSWSLSILHDNLIDPANSHEHVIQSFAGAAGSFVAPDHGYPSRLLLKLTATDSAGLATTTSVTLIPATATINFASSPPGLKVGVNGESFTTPFVTTVLANSANSISTPVAQVLNGVTYNFAGWSDGGAAAHNVTAADGAIYTASFTSALAPPDVTTGLVHRFRAEENAGANTTDSVTGVVGNLRNGPTWTTGRNGTAALNFDGVDDYVAANENLAATLGTVSTTLAAWIKTTQVGDNLYWQAPGIAGVEQAGDDEDSFWGFLDATGRIGVQVGDGPAAKSAAPVNDGQWHHVAFTRDMPGGQLKVYVDGALGGTAAGWQGPRDTPITGFGRIDDTAGTPTYFKGAIDDLRVYNRVLTAAEVAAVVAASTANAAPTIATPPAATPTPVVGKTANLSALAADDAGEAGLTYAWSVVGTPPAAVSFSANGTNAAKATVATFAKAGAYALRVTATDSAGLIVTADVSVTVAQTATALTVTPTPAPPVAVGGTRAFAAVVRDQFGDPLAAQPAVTWQVTTGGGSVSAAGVYTAPATPRAGYGVTATSGALTGTATGTIADAAPTIAAAPAATPSPVTGKTTALSVLGADDGGEANLTYTWSVVGTPPAAVAFDANGTNAAKAAVATFARSGAYTLKVDVSDGTHVASGTVVVTVAQTATAVTVTPPAPPVTPLNGQQAFIATVVDQFGEPLAAQPAVTWSVAAGSGTISAAGVYSAPPVAEAYRVRASAGDLYAEVAGTSAVVELSIANPPAAVPVGTDGSAVALSVLGTSGIGEAALTYAWSVVGTPPADVEFDVNGTNAAKSAIATFARAGVYDLRVTVSDGSQAVTADLQVTVAQLPTALEVAPAEAGVLPPHGQQQFTATLVDQFGDPVAGATPVVTWEVSGGEGTISPAGLFTAANGTGEFTVTATAGAAVGTATGSYANAAPTIATAPAAGPVVGATVALSALGADDGGEANLTYAWSVVGTPPTAVAFGATNGTNAAKSVVATFAKAGTYHLLVTISDGVEVTTALASVDVAQALTTIAVTPAAAPPLTVGQQQQFTAKAKDQFGDPMAAAPAVTWAVATGGGSVTAAGLYTAAGATGTAYTVTATSGTVVGAAGGTIANAAPTIAAAAAATPAPVAGKTTTLSVLGADDAGEAGLTYAWSVVGTPPAAVAFSAAGTNAAKSAVATFAKAGSYTLRATVTDVGGLSVVSDVAVTVAQTATTFTVTPDGATVPGNTTRAYAVTAADQFGAAMAVPAGVVWSLDAGSVGSVAAATGVYTAPATAGTAVVRATLGAVSDTAALTVTAATGGGDDTVTAGLLHRWRFDDGGGFTAVDSVGANNGTLTNGPLWAAGRSGTGAIDLDGVNDYVAVPNNLAATMGVGTTTLTAWIRTTQVGSNSPWLAPGITGVEQANSDKDSFWGFLDATGRIGVQVGDGPAAKSAAAVNDGQWHHVAFTRNMPNGALQVYVDGALGGTANGWQGNRDTPFTSIGRIEDTAGTPDHFKGTLDDVRVYNRVLTAAEVAAIRDAALTGPPANTAPTFATPAAASPATVTATTTSLSALAADNGGEAALTYAWATTAAPAGAPAVTFGANGTNAAKATTATFGKAGAYTFRVTATDAAGLSATSTVNVTVAQTFTSVLVSPSAPTVVVGTTQTFTATARDQFNATMTNPAAPAWTVVSGGGTINATTGVYTAPATGGAQTQVRATMGGKSASTTLTYVPAFAATKINFQPSAAATVSGYVVDAGAVFGSRGSNRFFGWSAAHADVVFDRGVNANQLLDTVVQLKTGAKWELAVPNGTYLVKLSIGDASAASTNTIRVEGTAAYTAVALAANVFQNKTVTVTVADGRLTIDNNAAANLATRLNYVEVTKA